MEKALIGAGGFAREIASHLNLKNIKYFVSDEYYSDGSENILRLSEFDSFKYEALIAVGDPFVRRQIAEALPAETKFFSFVHESAVILDPEIKIGEGSVICAGAILTTSIIIGKHAQLNLKTSIGHDCVIGDYFTTAPGVSVSGQCKIGNCVYLGTNAALKEKLSICDDVVAGLNAGIVCNLSSAGIYTGTPAKKKY